MSNLQNNNLKNIYTDLKKYPYKYSFFQTCFLLEKIHSDKKFFAYGTPKSEPIKLISYIHASTPFSTCIKIDEKKNLLVINSPALIGYNGILPNYYSDKIFFLEKQNSFLLSDFINIFQHRYYSIKYKLEKNYTQTLTSRSKFEEVFAISGLSDNKLKKYFNPFLSILLLKNKTKENLKKILENFVNDVTVQIHEFQEKWFDIPEKHRLYLNGEPLFEKALGNQTQVDYSAIKIIFLFDDFSFYMQYLEDDSKQKKIAEIIKYFLNGEFDYIIKLKIKKHTSKTFSLNSKNKLGLTTWV